MFLVMKDREYYQKQFDYSNILIEENENIAICVEICVEYIKAVTTAILF